MATRNKALIKTTSNQLKSTEGPNAMRVVIIIIKPEPQPGLDNTGPGQGCNEKRDAKARIKIYYT